MLRKEQNSNDQGARKETAGGCALMPRRMYTNTIRCQKCKIPQVHYTLDPQDINDELAIPCHSCGHGVHVFSSIGVPADG